MKAPKQGVTQKQRHTQSRPQDFRKLGLESGGKAPPPLDAMLACGPAQGPLGGDVHRIGCQASVISASFKRAPPARARR